MTRTTVTFEGNRPMTRRSGSPARKQVEITVLVNARRQNSDGGGSRSSRPGMVRAFKTSARTSWSRWRRVIGQHGTTTEAWTDRQSVKRTAQRVLLHQAELAVGHGTITNTSRLSATDEQAHDVSEHES